jgi:hypothetical protein
MPERCIGLHWQPWIEPAEDESEVMRTSPAGWRAPLGAAIIAFNRADLVISVERGAQVSQIKLRRKGEPDAPGHYLLHFHVANDEITCEPYLRWTS